MFYIWHNLNLKIYIIYDRNNHSCFLCLLLSVITGHITWKCTSLAMLGSAINIWCSREQMRHCTSLISLSNPPSVHFLGPTSCTSACCDHRAPAFPFLLSVITEPDKIIIISRNTLYYIHTVYTQSSGQLLHKTTNN